jgi:hypothetical protein
LAVAGQAEFTVAETVQEVLAAEVVEHERHPQLILLRNLTASVERK